MRGDGKMKRRGRGDGSANERTHAPGSLPSSQV